MDVSSSLLTVKYAVIILRYSLFISENSVASLGGADRPG